MEQKALLLSTSLSVLSMYLVYQYLSGEDTRLRNDYAKVYPMVVAARDILQYETIRPTDIEVIQVPAAMVPPGMITDAKDLIDSVASVPMSKGEHILDNKIISKNIYSGLDTQVALGKRAVSIPVNVKSAVGYMIRPGNRIDLGAHFEYKSNNQDISEVKLFLQDLLVLASGRTIQSTAPRAVDQRIVRSVMDKEDLSPKPSDQEVRDTLNHAKSDNQYLTLTLEVTPQQAQSIVYVMATYGDSVFCLLRNSDDRVVQRGTTTNLYDVMGPESYLVKGQKLPPPRAIPKVRFNDYIGEQQIGVTDGKDD